MNLKKPNIISIEWYGWNATHDKKLSPMIMYVPTENKLSFVHIFSKISISTRSIGNLFSSAFNLLTWSKILPKYDWTLMSRFSCNRIKATWPFIKIACRDTGNRSRRICNSVDCNRWSFYQNSTKNYFELLLCGPHLDWWYNLRFVGCGMLMPRQTKVFVSYGYQFRSAHSILILRILWKCALKWIAMSSMNLSKNLNRFTNDLHNSICGIVLLQSLDYFSQQIQEYRIAAHICIYVFRFDQFLNLFQIFSSGFSTRWWIDDELNYDK